MKNLEISVKPSLTEKTEFKFMLMNKEKKLGKIVSLSCLFSLWGLLSTLQTRLPIILAYLMLLYTSLASGASSLELSVSSRTACYSYFSWFFFSVPVFQFMMSEYPILIKSAKGRPGIKHFKIGH